jgi:hypothetical protein
MPPVPPKVDASTETGNRYRDIDGHATLALANPDMSICAIATGFYFCLKVNSLPEIQVVDSLPLEESFSPKLLSFGFTWVCSTILARNSPS